jgi:hypothetical protein
MGSLLVQVAVYGLAAACAAPVAAVVSAVILGKSSRPILGTWTFAAGAAFLDVLLAVVVLASGAFESGSDAGDYLDVGLGILFGAMGILAVFETPSPEKEAAQRARAERIATAKITTLFAAGILVQIINFDAIAVFGGAVKEIAEADVTTAEAAFALVFGLAIMLSVYYGPAVVYALVPKRAGPLLGRMVEWIMGNLRIIEVVVGIGFGAYFLVKGLSALL